MSEKKRDNVALTEDFEATKGPKSITHKVVKGDTIRLLAMKYLGKSSRANEIRKANDLPSDILFVGQTIKIPKK